MKILLCHNYYQMPGGEDQVYEDEVALLEEAGHQVIRMERHNSAIAERRRFDIAQSTFWSGSSYREVTQLIAQHRPQVAHFHNTFPLISPSGYAAAKEAGVAVVQTLHNFRTICPAASLLRDNAPCERCVNRAFAWPAVRHACYRNSRSATAVTAAANAYHRLRGTWHQSIDRFIALTCHSRTKFMEGGLPADKIAVKPNCVRPDPGRVEMKGQAAVFVGRLAPEKGIDTLLAAWRRLGDAFPLRIIGDGPLREQVEQAQRQQSNVRWLGQLPFEEVLKEIGQAYLLVFPSIWYETFGRSMIEAFATGTPVVASDIGAMQELVTDGINGFHFRSGDPVDLAEKAGSLFHDTALHARACRNARQEYEDKYTATRNYELLIEIYQQAIQQAMAAASQNKVHS